MAAKKPAPSSTTPAPPAVSKEIHQTIASPSRCKCQSTNRSDYGDTKTTRCSTTVAGLPVTRIIRRRCKCLDCGQARIDKSYEYHPEDEAK